MAELGSYGPEVSAAGYGIQAFAQIVQGLQAAKRARAIRDYNVQAAGMTSLAQAQAAEVEALQQERQADQIRQDQALAVQAQAYREARDRERHAAVIGQTRAIIASSGVMQSGSPLAALERTIRNQELDLLAQRYTAQTEMRAQEQQAQQAEYGAALSRFGGMERLRIGKAAAGLLKAQTDTSQVGAGLLKSVQTGAKGMATYNYLNQRRKGQTLLSGYDD